MKKQKLKDKYGFVIYDSYKCKKHNVTYVNVCYENKVTGEDTTISFVYSQSGMLKRISQCKEIEEKLFSMNIIEGFNFAITSRFGEILEFDTDYELFDLILDIPDSLVLNDDAMKEFIENLPINNKTLLVYVIKHLKEKRAYLQSLHKSTNHTKSVDSKESYIRNEELKL